MTVHEKLDKLIDRYTDLTILLVETGLTSNTYSYINNKDYDINCIFTITNFRGSVGNDTLTLTGCTINQTFYEIQSNLCICCYKITIPANTTFTSITKYVSNQNNCSALSLIQFN